MARNLERRKLFGAVFTDYIPETHKCAPPDAVIPI